MPSSNDQARGSHSRRLAAVWFADIVGFTSLASRDEDTALRIVEAFQETTRQVVESRDGTLVKFMGDGALAYFTSTSMALDAAVTLRDEFAGASPPRREPTLLRFGVHVGDIVISPSGDIFGDGVNVASRLQEYAPPGAVVLSEDVWRQCRQRSDLRFASLGPQALKGIDEPVSLYQLIDGAESDPGRDFAEDRSLAVLPFDNLSGTDEAEALATGLQNSLVTELSKVPDLKVISRTSVMAYRDTDKSVRQIARELQVGSIVEGAVQSVGSRIRLTVQLIDPQHDVNTWAESFDRELSAENLFGMQSELTEKIVVSLQAELTPEQKSDVAHYPTFDLDAYRLQAQGRMKLDLRTESGFRKAIELFQKAVERDPDYALAWVGLADALTLLEDYGHGETYEALTRAREAIRRALEIDPSLAEAHASLGLLHSAWQDGPEAIRELELAVKLRPGYAEAHSWLSWLDLLVGNADRALPSAKRAVQLNPLSAEAVDHLCLAYLASGRTEEAVTEARRAAELSPEWPTPRFYCAVALYEAGEFGEAEHLLEDLSVEWTGQGAETVLALCQAARDHPTQCRETLSRIRAKGDHFGTGVVLLALGEPEAAFEAFQSIDEVGPWPALAIHHFYSRIWDPVRGDPRHGELVRLAKTSWKLNR